jgi:hypothetical protein
MKKAFITISPPEVVSDPAGMGRGFTATRICADLNGNYEEWIGNFWPTYDEAAKAASEWKPPSDVANLMQERDQLRKKLHEALDALQQVDAELGTDSRWKVSRLRLDVVRPTIASLAASSKSPPR